MKIHPTAVIHPSAEIAEDVEIGPYCVIGQEVRIGRGTSLQSHVIIDDYTTVGEACQIRQQVVLGGPPQDFKFKGERSYLVIGNRNIIREAVTIHRATGEDQFTRIGDDNMIMAYCHVGHNCTLGNGIMMANQVGISGHCIVEDRVVLGGILGIHQFVRIGKLAMVGGASKVVQDVPPFMMVDGRPTQVIGLNVLGLRRAGVPPAGRAGLKQCYKLIYRSEMNLSQGITACYEQVETTEERDYLLSFLDNMRRGYGGRGEDPRAPAK